ncbi:hypothetical protein [Deinococcus sonorensis]|uniref:KfrA N-terminal DNA-binding domain-containing protein n=2 Tax=Deinococcus sonorensis TaxID=309891 RepID=A0AAU7U6R2_9DEIO
MTDDLRAGTNADDADKRAERHMVDAARQHVGAAGFAQRNVLEQLIAAGREQIAYTGTLRQVVASTLRQLGEERLEGEPGQLVALQQIVTSGQRQIETARQLTLSIQHTLSNVRSTPLELVSAHLLSLLSESVHHHARNLELLIQAALEEASSSEQVAQLKQVRADMVATVLEIEHDGEERALAQLDLMAQQAVEQVRSLEAEGQTHAVQRTQLEQMAVTSQEAIEHLRAKTRLNREELERLGQERDTLHRQTAQLTQEGDEVQAKLDQARLAAEDQRADTD